MTTVLVVGSKRVRNLDKVLNVLNHSGLPVQLIVVAGGDDELYAWLQETEWHGVVHTYNFVENMPALMRASNCIITKAGGLIVTESIAAGLPMLLVDVTPGQEEGNAEYVVKNGAAERAEEPLDALEILCHWLWNDGLLLRERAERARELGRPMAAFSVADLIWTISERGPLPIPESRKTFLPKLMEMLNQFGLVGENPADEPKAV